MPTWEGIALGIIWLYLSAHVGAAVLWGVHHYSLRRGATGLLAPQWSLLDLWLGFHLVLLLTFTALLGMGLLVGLALVLAAPAQLDALIRAWQTSPTTPTLLWSGLLSVLLMQNAALGAVAIWYTLVKYRQDTAGVGLAWRWDAVRQGAVWGILALPVTLLLGALSNHALRLFLGAPTFQRLSDWERQTVSLEAMLETLPSGLMMVGFLLVVAVAAPVGEELFFRGFVFNVLRRRIGFGWAVWLSAALFALLHASLRSFVPILVIGALLAWLYARTGSLWSCVVMHGTFNFLSASAAMLFGGS